MPPAGIGAKAAKLQAAVVGTPQSERKRVRRRFRHAPAIAAAVGMVVLWQLIVIGLEVPTYIAPSPLQVLEVFVEHGDILWINFLPTLLEVRIVVRADSGFCRRRLMGWCERHGIGYILGLARNPRLAALVRPAMALAEAGFVGGVRLRAGQRHRGRARPKGRQPALRAGGCGSCTALQMAERAFYPIAVFINTIPIIAVAPILVLMLGNGYAPKIVIAALICFFPTLVNMVRGLKAVSPQMLELMRVLSASDREVLFKIRLQSSLPFLFAALKIASTTCVIGAIVGEWIGSNYGLGSLIIEATYNFRAPLLYATVILGAGLAVAFFVTTSLVERHVLKWKPGGVY